MKDYSTFNYVLDLGISFIFILAGLCSLGLSWRQSWTATLFIVVGARYAAAIEIKIQ